MRQLLLVLALVALAFSQATNFCMTSSGEHTPSTIVSPGNIMKAGYRYAYTTIHEASDVTVETGSYTVTFLCGSEQITVSSTFGAVTTHWDRTSETPDLSDPASWQPASGSGSTCDTATFQSGAVVVPDCAVGDLSIVSQRICLSVTATNNIDTLLFEWHSDDDNDETICAPWSDGKQITPAPDCGTDFSVITNVPCSVSCMCFGFEMISNVYNADGTNTFTFKVWNMCDTGTSYIAFGTAGLTRISPTDGSSYTSPEGVKYQVYWMGTDGNPGFESIKFQGGGSALQGGGSNTFTFTVGGWYPGYVWTLQGHRGGFYETFAAVDLSDCCPTESSCPETTICEPGVGTVDGVCDESVCADKAPNGFQWICRWNGVNDWYLDAVPEGSFPPVTDPPTWFDPVTSGDNAAPGTDPMGYQVGCDCKRVYKTCPDNCCGLGDCNSATGECTCTEPGASGINCCTYVPPTGGSVQVTITGGTTGSSGSTTSGTQIPCYNDGVFCSAHGKCNVSADECVCDENFSGVACEVETVPPSCFDYVGTDAATCTDCITADPSLKCVWCAGIAGEQCLPFDACDNPQFTCDEGVVPTPTDCQTDEDCNGKGTCVVSDEGNYCQCDDGERGSDCSSGGLSNLGKALAISGGIVAVIVIGGVVALFLLGFGAKKGYDYLTLHEINMGKANTNPFYHGNTSEHVNATFSGPN